MLDSIASTEPPASETHGPSRVYGGPPDCGWIGIVGLVFPVVTLLESLRILPHTLSKPDGFPLDSWGTWVAYAILVGLGSLLIAVWRRFRLVIDDDGVNFRGVFTNWQIQWADVAELRIRPASPSGRKVILRTVGGSRRSIPITELRRGRTALRELVATARRQAPSLAIDGLTLVER